MFANTRQRDDDAHLDNDNDSNLLVTVRLSRRLVVGRAPGLTNIAVLAKQNKNKTEKSNLGSGFHLDKASGSRPESKKILNHPRFSKIFFEI